MSTGPTITSWTSREIADAAIMNARVRDVNTWLANPPAARVHGKPTAIATSVPGLLTFWAPGKETFTPTTTAGLVVASYQSVSGMIKIETDEVTVKELVAPVAGRYRITLGAVAGGSVAAPVGAPFNCNTYLGVNPSTAGDEGTAVVNAAITGGSLAPFSTFTCFGTRSMDTILAAGARIRAAAEVEGTAWTFANSATTPTYQSSSFLELRWIGEVPT